MCSFRLFLMLLLTKCISTFDIELQGKFITIFKNTTYLTEIPDIKYIQLIKVYPYDKTVDTEVQYIKDLSYLKYVVMEDIGQENVPSFKNLRLLTTINLSKNNIVKVPSDVFVSTPVQNIFLNQNEINKIEDNSFGANIKWVNLACNQLNAFSTIWFVNPVELKRLNLSGNKIKNLSENTFQKFINLNDINLSYNQLVHLPSGTFSGRQQYDWIYLNNNQLVELHPDVFKSKQIEIDNLYIGSNKLIYIPLRLINSIDIKKSVGVKHNPWQCPCYENIRERFVRNGAIIIEDGIRCDDNTTRTDCERPNYNNKFLGIENFIQQRSDHCKTKFDSYLEI